MTSFPPHPTCRFRLPICPAPAAGDDVSAIDPALSVFVDAIPARRSAYEESVVRRHGRRGRCVRRAEGTDRATGTSDWCSASAVCGTGCADWRRHAKDRVAAFRTLPLTADEFATIAANVAPYAFRKAKARRQCLRRPAAVCDTGPHGSRLHHWQHRRSRTRGGNRTAR